MRSPRPLDEGATVLVGRETELRCINDVVARASRGSGQLLLVEGEPGIGKSAVLSCAVEAARAAGMTILTGRCDELGGSRPFAPWLEALETSGPAAASGLIQVRQSLATARRGPPSPLDIGSDAQSLTVDTVVEVVDGLCVSGPVAIALDDVQWADAASIVAVSALARHADDLPLLLILTFRPLPPAWAPATLVATLESRRASHPVTHLMLGALTDTDANIVAADRVGCPIGSHLGALVARCGGNPLLVLEVVAGLADAGRLRHVGDVIDADLGSSGHAAGDGTASDGGP